MDKKRLIILSLFVLLAVFLGVIFYRKFFAPTPGAKLPPAGSLPSGTSQLPIASEGGPTITPTRETGQLPISRPSETTVPSAELTGRQAVSSLTTNPVKGVGVDSQGRINLYNGSDGKFYRFNKNGTLEALSDAVFYQVQNITWSPADSSAILEYPDGANVYYNFVTKKQVTLPKHWENFSFSASGDKIAAKSIGFSPENRWLVTANPDGGDINLIEPLGENADKVTVDWSPNRQIVALSQTGQGLGADRQEILFVGLQGENFKSITVEGRRINSRWSLSGQKLLYSVDSSASDFKPQLWIVNTSGDDIGAGRKLLGVNTWAEKCAFADERYIYCAVPTGLQRGAGFAPQVANNTPDAIYKIDTQTGLRSAIFSEGNHTVDALYLSEDRQTLYFTDKREPGLFKIDL